MIKTHKTIVNNTLNKKKGTFIFKLSILTDEFNTSKPKQIRRKICSPIKESVAGKIVFVPKFCASIDQTETSEN